MQTADSVLVSRETPGVAIPKTATVAEPAPGLLSGAGRRNVEVAARRKGKARSPDLAPRSLDHLTLLRQLAEQQTLGFWAARYLAEEVYGVQSPNTLDAKSRDLVAFAHWFACEAGEGAIDAWLPRHTRVYLDSLEQQGRAPATINRVFATLRRFARWANEQPGDLFSQGGMPTRGIKELEVAEADCQRMTPSEVAWMFAAADSQVESCRRKNQRPRRNRAILAVLYYTGLRVSELVTLRRDQYDGRYLVNVRRKGKARSREVYLSADCRCLLDDYLKHERPQDLGAVASKGALLAGAGSDKPLTRRMVAKVLEQLAATAAQAGEGAMGKVHPHRLRHTFGAEYRERSGSDTETAVALGHTSLDYVGRYVRRSRQQREEILDAF